MRRNSAITLVFVLLLMGVLALDVVAAMLPLNRSSVSVVLHKHADRLLLILSLAGVTAVILRRRGDKLMDDDD